MRQNTILAALLIALGVAAFSYQGITYKTREKTLDLGSLQVTTERTKKIPFTPTLGVVALLGGIALLIRNPPKI